MLPVVIFNPNLRLFEIARVLVRLDSRCRRRRRKFVSAELLAAYRACAACDGFGFVPNTAAPTFDVLFLAAGHEL
jgi:hypothetical protein